jgi:hypothetical protein
MPTQAAAKHRCCCDRSGVRPNAPQELEPKLCPQFTKQFDAQATL